MQSTQYFGRRLPLSCLIYLIYLMLALLNDRRILISPTTSPGQDNQTQGCFFAGNNKFLKYWRMVLKKVKLKHHQKSIMARLKLHTNKLFYN